MAGVPPSEGTATATVRDGRITDLALAAAPGSVGARQAAVEAAVAAALTRSGAAHSSGDGSPSPARPASSAPAPAAPDLVLLAVLAGLGSTALALALLRGRAHRAQRRSG
jgi:hypothetical protein